MSIKKILYWRRTQTRWLYCHSLLGIDHLFDIISCFQVYGHLTPPYFCTPSRDLLFDPLLLLLWGSQSPSDFPFRPLVMLTTCDVSNPFPFQFWCSSYNITNLCMLPYPRVPFLSSKLIFNIFQSFDSTSLLWTFFFVSLQVSHSYMITWEHWLYTFNIRSSLNIQLILKSVPWHLNFFACFIWHIVNFVAILFISKSIFFEWFLIWW